MKIYKLDGLEKYTVAFNKQDAVFTFLINKMGVTVDNVIELDTAPNRDAIGKVFISLNDLLDFEIDY